VKTSMKLVALMVAVLGFAIGGCATAPAPYQARPYPQQQPVIVMVQPQQQAVPTVMQGVPTIAGGVIIPNGNDVRYGYSQGYGYQMPMPGYPCNPGFMPCRQGGYINPVADLERLAVGAAGTAADTAIYCAISHNCGRRDPVVNNYYAAPPRSVYAAPRVCRTYPGGPLIHC